MYLEYETNDKQITNRTCRHMHVTCLKLGLKKFTSIWSFRKIACCFQSTRSVCCCWLQLESSCIMLLLSILNNIQTIVFRFDVYWGLACRWRTPVLTYRKAIVFPVDQKSMVSSDSVDQIPRLLFDDVAVKSIAFKPLVLYVWTKTKHTLEMNTPCMCFLTYWVLIERFF